MEAHVFNELLPDYVLGKLTAIETVSFEAYMIQHPDAAATVEDWRALISLGQDTLGPSAEMDRSFYAVLEQEMVKESHLEEMSTPTSSKVISIHSWKRPLYRFAAAAVILLIGLFIGSKLGDGGSAVVDANNAFAKADTQSIQDAENETEEVRSQLVIALADQPSASKRLQAVSEVNKMTNANDQVIMALFKMLNSDPNVNVRLAAVTSLSKYVDNPKVREGLVMSITKQASPLVQIALAELMVTLKEQKSIDSMETLLQQPDINAAVKLKLEESIKRII